ncbi:hypothetical protein EDB19DRAFT_1829949 [Suillus lakei]|nr:hypothetical protein EDB19DRAFT_1829949 [Suillus lakei]
MRKALVTAVRLIAHTTISTALSASCGIAGRIYHKYLLMDGVRRYIRIQYHLFPSKTSHFPQASTPDVEHPIMQLPGTWFAASWKTRSKIPQKMQAGVILRTHMLRAA